MHLDAATLAPTTVFEGDICVAGSGPAGLVVADSLARAGHAVVVLESGADAPDAALDELNDGDTAGDPFGDLRRSRRRQLGGTPRVWNTGLGGQPGARYAPLDPIDLEARAWIPHSGWPLAFGDLDPWYRQAHELCGLGPWQYDAPGILSRLGEYGLAARYYRLGLAQPFTSELPAGLVAHSGVQLLTRASVTRVHTEQGTRLPVTISWRSLAGTSGTVRARCVVLAMGAIENARVLLVSGYRSYWLGRGFMEHPRDRSLQVVGARRVIRSVEQFIEKAVETPRHGTWGRLAVLPEVLERDRLLNASVVIYPEADGSFQPSLLRRATRRLLGSAWHDTYGVTLHLEQAPDPANRVVLSPRTDAFGTPLPRLEWHWRHIDESSRTRVRRLVASALEGLRFGRVEERIEAQPDPEAHHHAGTTRMAHDPHQGVVDVDGRLHEAPEVYVAGASVFPTAGFVNPTLTVVALALRMARHLDQRLSRHAP